MSDFDPTATPAPDDIVNRGVRLGTVASVISGFYAAAPTLGMLDNIFNPDLLAVWPLRDEVSQEGVALLLSGHDHQGPLRSEWLNLYGYQPSVLPTESARGNSSAAAANAALYQRDQFSAPQVADAPADHIGPELAYAGHVATSIAMQYRAGVDVSAEAKGLLTFVREHVGPLGNVVVAQTKENAETLTYQAIALLTQGYLAELESFAEYNG
ncbi:molecular chaperone TorD family protein [Ancrocorticia populi]|uniref:molecular chaperone TorD family protein n=1 Tax=Ancrocorticia populi TaxID=2175228 RepID=UPI00235362DF|nr:molecular chaperone TorD family protein [Ancrocorticia populi]